MKMMSSYNRCPTGQTAFHPRVYYTRAGSTSKMNFMEEDRLPPGLQLLELLFMEEDRLAPDLARAFSQDSAVWAESMFEGPTI